MDRTFSDGRARRLALVALLLLGVATPVAAQEAAPSSRELLRSMTDTLQKAKQLSFHAEINFDEALPSGQLLQFAGAAGVKLRRPNGLFVDYRDDLGAKQVWYDGKTFTVFDPAVNVYAKSAAPPEVEPAMEKFERDHGVFLPLAELVIGDAYADAMKHTVRGSYIGIHDVDGTPCHHLAFVSRDFDWQLWLETGKTPVPRKLVVTFKNEPGSPQYVANLMDWELDAKLRDADFAATLPDGAISTEFLVFSEVRQ